MDDGLQCYERVALWTFMVIIVLLPDMAFAGGNPVGTTLCSAARWFTSGTVGFGLLAVGICIFAVAMVMNKMTWPMVILGFIDAAIMFSADWFVVTFGGTACPP
jgi:type IV secretory pathway VirB2 component (pilin)